MVIDFFHTLYTQYISLHLFEFKILWMTLSLPSLFRCTGQIVSNEIVYFKVCIGFMASSVERFFFLMSSELPHMIDCCTVQISLGKLCNYIESIR